MFSGDALVVGLIEALKVWVVLGVASLISRRGGWFFAGWALALMVSVVMVSTLKGPSGVDFWTALRGYVFGLVYILSLLVLYEETGEDVFGPLRRLSGWSWLTASGAFVFSFFYFLPDTGGTIRYLIDLSQLKESLWPWFWAVGGGLILSVLFYSLRKRLAFVREYFQWPQFFLTGALLKLISGTGTEFSMVRAVQKGLMKFNHDIIHQTFVTIMVPDHPILTTTAWNFIGFFFSDTFTIYMALVVLWVPLVAFIVRYYNAPVQVPEDMGPGPRRRLYIKTVRMDRLKKLLPVVLVALYVVGAWFSGRAETVESLYNPEPVPLVVEGQRLSIPIEGKTWDLRDGAIHKFVVHIKGQDIRFFVFQRPDGTLVACLDACEICPPEGYAQAERFMVCLYCRTPIDFDSLGRSGGCNPIPLEATVTDRDVVISVEELQKKWAAVKTGRTREVIH